MVWNRKKYYENTYTYIITINFFFFLICAWLYNHKKGANSLSLSVCVSWVSLLKKGGIRYIGVLLVVFYCILVFIYGIKDFLTRKNVVLQYTSDTSWLQKYKFRVNHASKTTTTTIIVIIIIITKFSTWKNIL